MFIGYLGPKGSFSHHVAQKAFPKGNLVPLKNITEVMKAYESGQVDYSIVPVENSIEGSVHETHRFRLPRTSLRRDLIRGNCRWILLFLMTKHLSRLLSRSR